VLENQVGPQVSGKPKAQAPHHPLRMRLAHRAKCCQLPVKTVMDLALRMVLLRAVELHHHGPPEPIDGEESPRPEPGPIQILHLPL
jgi:hypothetical protein